MSFVPDESLRQRFAERARFEGTPYELVESFNGFRRGDAVSYSRGGADVRHGTIRWVVLKGDPPCVEHWVIIDIDQGKYVFVPATTVALRAA